MNIWDKYCRFWLALFHIGNILLLWLLQRGQQNNTAGNPALLSRCQEKAMQQRPLSSSWAPCTSAAASWQWALIPWQASVLSPLKESQHSYALWVEMRLPQYPELSASYVVAFNFGPSESDNNSYFLVSIYIMPETVSCYLFFSHLILH